MAGSTSFPRSKFDPKTEVGGHLSFPTVEKGVFREDITVSLMQKAYATSGLMLGHLGSGNLSNTLQICNLQHQSHLNTESLCVPLLLGLLRFRVLNHSFVRGEIRFTRQENTLCMWQGKRSSSPHNEWGPVSRRHVVYWRARANDRPTAGTRLIVFHYYMRERREVESSFRVSILLETR